MQLITRTDWDRPEGGERVLALGTFDGVHRGHRALLEAGMAYARREGLKLRVCTFDRHPLEVICPEKAPRVLTPLPEKIRLMEEMGVDELQLIPFNRETAGMEPEVFLEKLRQMVRLRAIAAGWNYTFGKGGRGNADMLNADGPEHGYDVLIVPPVTLETGEPISSSLIREALEQGRIREAEEMLGHAVPAEEKVQKTPD